MKRIPKSKFLGEVAPKWHKKVAEKTVSSPDAKDTRWYSMAWIMLGLDLWHDMFLNEETPEAVSW
jgi:hypothetical protein